MAKIVLQNPQALVALPVLWLLLVAFAWRRRFIPFSAFLVRGMILVLVVLALSQPAIPASEAANTEILQQRVVVLVDQSASLTEAEQQMFRAEANRLTQQLPNLVTLYFADQPVIPNDANAASDVDALPLNRELSNLAEALLLGAEVLNGQPGRLVLLSDGVPTTGNLETSLNQLAQQKIPVDVLILNEAERERLNDVRLVDLSIPSMLRQGESFSAELTLYADVATQIELALVQDTTPLAESAIAVEAGFNRFNYDLNAQEVGLHTFRATIVPIETEDSQPANNTASAFTQVYPPPRILVVSDEATPAARMTNWLEEAGFVPEIFGSDQLPKRLSELEPYAGMVIINVSARALELEQMIAVQEFVRSLGRGLLVTGGRSSYSLGEYEDTPLADIIPLSLEPPPREERPPVALLLMIDHSGSMGEEREPATSLAMAKEAAIRATDILGPDDLIGILMFDNKHNWVVPFQPAEDGAVLLNIQSQIATIPVGGGTRILPALETGLTSLAAQDTFDGPRHAVLLSDGKSVERDKSIEDYDVMVDFALESDITLSTIAIGVEADQELLSHIAERGLGRYHFAAVPDELPALTIAESDILRSDAVQEGDYFPALFAPHPVLRGLAPASVVNCTGESCLQEASNLNLPNLSGYIAMTPKPRAEVALQVGSGDPLLALWGYGLGRVAAWSSDSGDEWGRDWNNWPEASRFWGQVVGYTLPAPNLGLLQLDVELEPDGLATLTAEGVTATGQTVDLARTEATLITPGGREVALNLRQIAPGRYQQQVKLADPGAYQLTVTQTRTDEADETATIGFVMPYPAEYAFVEPDDKVGRALLEEIAAATGGRIFSLGESLLNPSCDPQLDDCETDGSSAPLSLENLDAAVDLWPWLLLAALILWPVEIGLRRWGRLRIQ